MGNILTFQVETECRHNFGENIRDSCKVEFDGTKVTKFGQFAADGIPGDPDIAGQGVLLGFFVPCFVVLILGLAVLGSDIRYLLYPEQNIGKEMNGYTAQKSTRFLSHPLFRVFMLDLADGQILLMLAYGINFYIRTKCTMSMYHFRIFLHMILVACATLITAVLVLPNFFQGKGLSFVSSLFRAVAMLAVFLFRAIFVLALRNVKNARYLPQMPPKSDNDSILLLPVACYIDPDPTPFEHLDPEAKAYLGAGEEAKSGKQQVEFLLGCGLAIFFIVAFFGQFVFFILNARAKSQAAKDMYNFWRMQRERGKGLKGLIILTWCLTWLYCAGVVSYSVWYIINIREWVNKSGWLVRIDNGKNPEYQVYGVGQLLPLVAFAAVLFD